MIDVGECYFACDECPISDGVEYRLRIAEEGGYEPQLEYCGCDKIQDEFLFGGYCEDAFVCKPRKKKTGKRRTGSEYRRAMRIKHRDDLMAILDLGYKPYVGWADWEWVDGVWKRTGTYIKFPRDSRKEKYLKKCANRHVRRSKEIYRGNQYKKCYEYWWQLY